jgi:hypothetical protein
MRFHAYDGSIGAQNVPINHRYPATPLPEPSRVLLSASVRKRTQHAQSRVVRQDSSLVWVRPQRDGQCLLIGERVADRDGRAAPPLSAAGQGTQMPDTLSRIWSRREVSTRSFQWVRLNGATLCGPAYCKSATSRTSASRRICGRTSPTIRSPTSGGRDRQARHRTGSG